MTRHPSELADNCGAEVNLANAVRDDDYSHGRQHQGRDHVDRDTPLAPPPLIRKGAPLVSLLPTPAFEPGAEQ